MAKTKDKNSLKEKQNNKNFKEIKEDKKNTQLLGKKTRRSINKENEDLTKKEKSKQQTNHQIQYYL